VILAYDNMCHLDALKIARKPLPLPKPMWLAITKVIDELHIKNHVDETCKEKYDPSVIKCKHPGISFMSAERTFAWLSRFRRILCAMPKVHHLFYLVKRWNLYMEMCHSIQRKPLLPKVDTQSRQFV
jgi:hypothetical protein